MTFRNKFLIFLASFIIFGLVAASSLAQINVKSDLSNAVQNIQKVYFSPDGVRNPDPNKNILVELQNGVVKKIVAEHFGESWNSLTEYYVKNGKVYFIFDKAEKYNVPYYVDSKWYKENKLKNGEVFDKRKSKFSEQRYYFDENEKLIRYIGENKKIVENGQKLKEIEKDILNEYYRIKN